MAKSRKKTAPVISVGLIGVTFDGEEAINHLRVSGGVAPWPHQDEDTWDDVFANEAHLNKITESVLGIIEKALKEAGYKTKRD